MEISEPIFHNTILLGTRYKSVSKKRTLIEKLGKPYAFISSRTIQPGRSTLSKT